MTISYLATKFEFLKACTDGTIEAEIEAAYAAKFGKSGQAQMRSWDNSVADKFFKVLLGSSLPDNLGIAIEYQINSDTNPKRVDVMLSGYDQSSRPTIVIIELKQWSDVKPSDRPFKVDAVFVSGKRGLKDHPSKQALDYQRLIELFYSYAIEENLRVESFSFLHNEKDPSVVRDLARYPFISEAPVFLDGEFSIMREHLEKIFVKGDGGEVIRKLDASDLVVSPRFVDLLAGLASGNKYFRLSKEQRHATNEIIAASSSDLKTVVIVRGGPGTGKTLVACNALFDLIASGRLAMYVSKNSAPRTIYAKRLAGIRERNEVSTIFRGSDGFYNSAPNALDVVLVDEAHRLVPVAFSSKDKGKNQIREIIAATKHSVFFVDDAQTVTYEDFGREDNIAEIAQEFGVEPTLVELTAQFRCEDGAEYLDWVTQSLEPTISGSTVDLSDCTYDFRVFDNFVDMRNEVLAKPHAVESSRILAEYCWDWKSKKNREEFDFTRDEFGIDLRWNDFEVGLGWMDSPNAMNEIGCVYTMQGLDGDFMGVIIGPNVEIRDGELVTNPLKQAKTDTSAFKGSNFKNSSDPEVAKRIDELIRNRYRILLTRGSKGTYVYCTDPQVAAYFKSRLEAANYKGLD